MENRDNEVFVIEMEEETSVIEVMADEFHCNP
jgi:hypothetical protein